MDVYEVSQSVVPQCEIFYLRLGGFNFAMKLNNGKRGVLFLFFLNIFLIHITEFLLGA